VKLPLTVYLLYFYLDFNRYIGRTVPIGTPLSKAGGKPEPKKRWHTWSSGVPPRPSRFRETLMAKPAEAKQEKPVRPGHNEYQTTDGVAFPSATGMADFPVMHCMPRI